MKDSKLKLRKPSKNAIPIKYMLSLPIFKADLRDEKGNEIKDILSITYFNDGICVLTKDGVYLQNPFKKKVTRV